jgi:hypothetical protein
MGMVPASSPAFIRLSDGKVLGNATPAAVDGALRITPLPTRKPKNLRPTPIVIEVKPDAASATADGAATASGSTPAGTKKTQDGKHKQGSQR